MGKTKRRTNTKALHMYKRNFKKRQISVVSDAVGKVDTKPLQLSYYTSVTLKTLCRHTEQSGYRQGKVKPKI